MKPVLLFISLFLFCSLQAQDQDLEFKYVKTDEKKAIVGIKSVMNAQLANIIFNQIIEGKIKAYLPNTNTEYTTERIDSLMKSRIYKLLLCA